MRQQDYTKAILKLLQGLKRQYPTQEMSNHLFGTLAEYEGRFWGVSDKELYAALTKYSETLSIDEQDDLYQIYEEDIYREVGEDEEND